MFYRLIFCLLLGSLLAGGDEYDTLRQKWVDSLTGGNALNTTDPAVAAAINSVTNTANNNWSSMDKSATRTFLWSDAASTTNSSHLTTNFSRLRAMALAYRVTGSSLQGNATLRADIISGLDWLYANRYNQNKSIYDNWWDFEIGSPLQLVDATALLYEDLTATQRTNYMTAVNKFTPSATTPATGGTTGTFTGANRMWKIDVVAIRGIIVKDSAKIAAARDAFSNLFLYVKSGDGFYTDGSFLQHGKHPYTGGYGNSLLGTIAPIFGLLSGSTWAVTDPNQVHLYRWVYDAYEPLIYRGAMIPMVSGREVSRSGATDHNAGHSSMRSILRISQFAPPADAARMRAMVKYWAQTDTSRNFVSGAGLSLITAAQQLLTDPAVLPRGELVGNYLFADMDRVMHLRPGFGLGLSMSSSRIYTYESINSENLKGWHQGDGMTYLYNADLTHFTDAFWPTVNPRRLPGTTVDAQQTRANASGQSFAPAQTWTGGSSLEGYGVAGMQLDGWNSTLTGKKSWFMFDDEVVCLGSEITSTDARTIETIVENRMLNTAGTNRFTVNGTEKDNSPGWSEALSGVTWGHLAGDVSGADIGYYFPSPANVKGLRETRTGAWSDINAGGSTTPISRNYLTLWFDHGKSPTNATYSYVVLPGRTAARVADYAQNPHVTVLENSAAAQCVREDLLGVTAVNFWNNASRTSGGITVDKKASVITRNNGTVLDVAISDPTQANTGTIAVELAQAATASLTVAPEITVTQLTPTIRFTVNVNAASGKPFRASFYLGAKQTVALPAVADAYVYDGSPTSNYGSATSLAVKKSGAGVNRDAYLRFNLSTVPTGAVVIDSKLRLIPTVANIPGVHAVAPTTDDSWTESGLTWNNKPASGADLSSWTPALNTAVETDVTTQASSALTGSKLLSLRVYAKTQTTDGYVSYASRESSNTATRPQLLVTLGHLPPAVEITSPADGTLLNRPGSLTLNATATGADGTISSVAFYDRATLLGTVTSAPYSFTIPTLSGGSHRFTAVATDSNGLSATSLPVVTNVPYPPTAGAINVTTDAGATVDVDLLAAAGDVESTPAQLRVTLGAATNGTVALLADGRTARFIPAAGYSGPASFTYSVTDSTPDPRTVLNYAFPTGDETTDLSGNLREGTLVAAGTGTTSFATDVPASLVPQVVQSLVLTENGTSGAARLERQLPEFSFYESDWTVTGWCKRKTTTNFDALFHLGNGGGQGGANDFVINFDSGSNTLGLRNWSSTQDVAVSKTNVSAGAWHHFAAVRNGTTLSFYVDGVLVGSDSTFAFSFDASKPAVFGGVSSATDSGRWERWFNGALADVAIFSDALTAAEIAKLTSLPVANFSGQTASNTVNVTVRSALDNWRQQYFGTTAASGQSADQADPNRDGFVNLLEFFLHRDPVDQNPESTKPALSRNGSTLAFTYSRSIAALSQVTPVVEWSDVLASGNWSSAGVTEQILSDNGSVQQVKATVPMGSGGRRFVRLRVSLP